MIAPLMRKEIREHFPVALAGLACGMVAAVAHLRVAPLGHASRGMSRTEWWSAVSLGWPSVSGTVPIPVADSSYLGKLSVVCYGLALLLGFMMSWKESSRKTWPFLLHRPVTRGQVLAGKLITGTLMYFAAIGLPYAFLAYWSSVPGHYPAPWDTALLFPGLEIIARGYPAFLAAFLVGVRPARWYATRFAPLVAAIVFMLTSAYTPLWTPALAILLVAVLLLLAAIVHVFLRTKRLRPALTFLVMAGICGSMILLVWLAQSVMVPALDRSGLSWESIMFSKEGKPLIAHRFMWDRIQLKDLDRNLIGNIDSDDKRYLRMGSLWSDDSRRSRWRPAVYPVFAHEDTTKPVRYWLVRQDLLADYDWRTRRCLGFLTPKGLVADPADAVPFPRVRHVQLGWQAERGRVSVVTDDGLYQITGDRQVSRLVKGKLESWCFGYDDWDDRTTARAYARAGGHVVTASLNTGKAVTFALPAPLVKAKNLRVILISPDVLGVVAYGKSKPGENAKQQATLNTYACKIASSGKILWERRMSLASMPPDRAARAYIYLRVLAPGGNPLWLGSYLAFRSCEGTLEPLWQWLGGKENLAMPLAALLAKAFACAIACFVLIGRRGISVGWRLGWTLFAFAGGIPAVLTAAVVLLSEKRIPCPACGRRRPPSLEKCPRCGAEWERRFSSHF